MSNGTPYSVTPFLAASAGLTSLVLELLWIRLAGIETGSPLAAFTLIITCFMLGSAAGAFVFGRVADRTESPLRVFGLSQIAMGLVGALTWVAAVRGGLARPILSYFELEPGRFSFEMVLVLTSGLLTAAAAFLTGGALPLLAKHEGQDSSLPWRAGRLASFLAAGGAAGALLCGFVLLPFSGLRASLLGMATLSALTGLAAVLAGARSPLTRAAAHRPTAGAPGRPDTGARVAIAALLISGLSLTVLEVAWTRLTELSFGSSAQAASIVLALVITGLAAGYAAGGRMARDHGAARILVWLLAAGALSLLAGDFLFGRLPALVTTIDGWVDTSSAGWRVAILHCALLLIPIGLPSVLLGAVYPIALSLVSQRRESSSYDGRFIGLASALSAAGNMVGPSVAFFGLMDLIGSRGCLIVPALALCLSALIAAYFSPQSPQERPTRLLIPSLAFALTLATILWLPWDPDIGSSGPYLYAPYYRSAMEQLNTNLSAAVRQRGELIFSREGPDSLVTVRRSEGGLVSLQVNGKTDASTGGDLKTQALMGHLPLLLHAAPAGSDSMVMIVGLGSGVTAAAALTHPVKRVDVYEVSPGVIAAAPFFVPTTGDLSSDPRMRLISGDVRTHLLFGMGRNTKYDVISSQPSNPWIAGQAILFTREFFELAASRLASNGVMCQWLQGQGLAAADFRSILATFSDVFPVVSLWEESNAGGDYLLMGSFVPIRLDATQLVDRMLQPRVAQDLERIEIRTPVDLLAHHVASGESLRKLAKGAVIQSEDLATLEFTAPMALHRETLGEILTLLEPARTMLPEMVVVTPDLAAELSLRVRAARDEREWAAGLGLLSPALQLDPDLVRAASYLDAGMRGHALEAVRALALRNPSRRTPHLMTAHILMSMPGPRSDDELATVIEELQLAVMLDPSEPHARLFLSRALRAAGSRDEALVENAAIRDPRPPEADSDRCAMFLESGDGASAEAACLEALSRDPDLAEAHANLGVLRSRRGRIREAEELYVKALELEPTLVDARYNLAALYERQARFREGFELLRSLHPAATDMATLELAARLAVGAGELTQARVFLRERQRRGPSDSGMLETDRSLKRAESGRNGLK